MAEVSRCGVEMSAVGGRRSAGKGASVTFIQYSSAVMAALALRSFGEAFRRPTLELTPFALTVLAALTVAVVLLAARVRSRAV